MKRNGYYVCSHYIDWFWTQNGKRFKKHASWLFEIPELHSRRGPGTTCLTALRQIVDGIDPDNNSKGCGGIMRVSPIALYTSRNSWQFCVIFTH